MLLINYDRIYSYLCSPFVTRLRLLGSTLRKWRDLKRVPEPVRSKLKKRRKFLHTFVGGQKVKHPSCSKIISYYMLHQYTLIITIYLK